MAIKQEAVLLSFSSANLTTLEHCVYYFGIAIWERTVSILKHQLIKKTGKWLLTNNKNSFDRGSNSHSIRDQSFSSKLSALIIQRMRWARIQYQLKNPFNLPCIFLAFYRFSIAYISNARPKIYQNNRLKHKLLLWWRLQVKKRQRLQHHLQKLPLAKVLT